MPIVGQQKYTLCSIALCYYVNRYFIILYCILGIIILYFLLQLLVYNTDFLICSSSVY